MNYAAAFATAFNEMLDDRGVKKQGPNGIKRIDASQVVEVLIDAEEGYSYSEYTHADPSASLSFRGPTEKYTVHDVLFKGRDVELERYAYFADVDLTQLDGFNMGALIERAVTIMANEAEAIRRNGS